MSLHNLAQELAAKGRYGDSVLVHMHPIEVAGLQALAQSHGTSLTINPDTGMPEAFAFLAPLLGAIMPALTANIPFLAPLFSSALMTGVTIGGTTALATGDIGKGLAAGLGAYGGADIGSALSSAGSVAPVSSSLGVPGASSAANSQAAMLAQQNTALGLNAAESAAQVASSLPGAAPIASAAPAATPTGIFDKLTPLGEGIKSLAGPEGRSAFMSNINGPSGLIKSGLAAATPMLTQTPSYKPPKEEESNYEGPYYPGERMVTYPTSRGTDDSSEWNYFSPNPRRPFASGGDATVDSKEISHGFKRTGVEPTSTAPAAVGGKGAGGNVIGYTGAGEPIYSSNPLDQRLDIGNWQQKIGQMLLAGKGARSGGPGKGSDSDSRSQIKPYVRMPLPALDRPVSDSSEQAYFTRGTPLASGGTVNMDDGSFVVDARTVSEIGNGSSNAGLEKLAMMGARPVRGPGDGTSDSINARIGGVQQARVARDEAIFSADAVRRIGGGSSKKGAQKLYEMMNRVHAARKKAKRGQDTNADRHLPA